MAVDTQTKRRSVSAYTGNVMYPVLGTADSALRREHIAWLYAGISAGGSPPVVGLVQMAYTLQRLGESH